MLTSTNTQGELLEEIERLRMRLEETEAIVEAIRNGIVDAVVVHSIPGERVYTLEGAERPYRLLVEAMRQGVAVLNSEGVVLYCNPCLAELFKMSVENITGCGIDSFAADADQAMITGMLEIGESKTSHKEVLLRLRNGTSFPAALAVSELPLQKFCLLISDLTQQKHYDELLASKAALLDSEIRYRRLFETAKDGILLLDTNTGSITDANPFMSELLGYSHEHFIGKELWEIGLFSDKAANEEAVRTLQERGYIRYDHLPLETNKGLRVEVEIVANAYREDHHKVIQCNIRDITERSHLERQMQKQATSLAELDRRKDEFLAMLSHELRNPLAPIFNAVQLLQLQKNADKHQQQACAIIERQVGQLTRLVDDLLEVSRITTGRIRLQQERILLNGVAERAAETARPLADQRRHELTVSLSPKPVWIFADAARLEQIIVNLLANAAKYTLNGGKISLTVRLEGDEAVLRVKDTGVGIAPELIPRIFDLFSQAERSLDRSQGGLGIGLCLVQRLVDMHQGKVEVFSTLDQGSEFVVRLSVINAPTGEPALPFQEITESNGRSLRVLVVDDNVEAAQTIGLLLEQSGHQVRTVHDGLAGLQESLVFRPDVVLLDIGLPGIDGYEVARRMRLQPGLKHVVLVATSGYGQLDDLNQSKNAGIDFHLVKPFKYKQVQRILASVSTDAP